MFHSLYSILFPKICFGCGKHLQQKLNHICIECRASLPRTNYHKLQENPLNKIFWGRIPIENVFSYYQFQQSGKVRRLMHYFKYKGVKEIGITVGELYGNELMEANVVGNIDLIVPVPIHQKKIKERGYNQSQFLAKGISNSTGIEYDPEVVIKNLHTGSQTKKDRYSRWQNISSSFTVVKKDELVNQHILLVDDVLTTGATIEACGIQLLQQPGVKISVATMACTI